MTDLGVREIDPVRLGDGRRLTLCETGDPHGEPAFYLHGTGSSRLEVAHFDASGRAHGLRLICWDRPGSGGSTYQPDRTLTSVVADARAVASRLGIDRTAVAGLSGGGSHVLALAAGAPDLVSRAVPINPGPPSDDAIMAELDPAMRRLMTMARDRPRAFRVVSGMLQADNPLSRRLQLRSLDPTDYEVITGESRPLFEAAKREGSRQPRAFTNEALIIWHEPWGLALDSFAVPVDLFAGSRDAYVSFSRRLESSGVTLHVFAGGHVSCFVPEVMNEVAAVLAGARES